MQEAKSQNPYQHTSHDRFLQQFKKSLDSRHQIEPKKELEGKSPRLSEIQIQSLTRKLLLDVEIIRGFSLPVWKFQRKFQKLLSLKELEQCSLRKWDSSSIKHSHLMAVGSSAAEDIESDAAYVRQILQTVQPGAVIPDADTCVHLFLDLDFKIRALATSKETNMILKDMLHTWLAFKILKKQPDRRIEDVKAELTEQLNRKFYNPNEEGHLGNRFMLISVGETQLSVDITTYQNIRRHYLHTPDRIQIPYNVMPIKKEDGSTTILLTDQAFQRNKKDYLFHEKPSIRPDITLLDLAQTLLDRKAKLVHFTSLETMDISGWFKLMQYYVNGYRSADDESKLLAIAALPGCEVFFEQTLFRFCRNHFQDDVKGIYFYLLNCLLCMSRYGFETHANIIRSFKPEWFGGQLYHTRSQPRELLHCPNVPFASEYGIGDTLKFSRMLSCMGLLMLSTEWEQGDCLNVEFTFTSGKPALRWTYRIEKRSYSLITFFYPRQSLNDFVEMFQESQTFFLGFMHGRKTKQDLSLLVTILKYLQVKETDILKLIQNLGDETKADIAKMVHFWIPIALQLREVPKLTSIQEILNFVRELLPTVIRPDLQKANRLFIQDLLNQCLSAEDPIDVVRMLSDVDQWETNYSWIFEGNECKSFQKLCLERIENLFNTSSITDLQNILSKIHSPALQREFTRNFYRRANHFLQTSESHEGLVACLVNHPWLYEVNLENRYPFVESLLKNPPHSEVRTALAQNYLGFYLKKGKDLSRIHSLLTLVRFGELPAETKKAVQAIYGPLITQLHDKKEYVNIVGLYRWLGISGTTTAAQFRAVLPVSLDEEFKTELRKFIIGTFDSHIGFQQEPMTLYKNLLNMCEWHREFPWLFTTEENFNVFQKVVFRKLEALLVLDVANALVSLKEILSVIDNPDHRELFSLHARSVMTKCLAANEQHLIWNLIYINLCLESFPWIYAEDNASKRELVSRALVIIGRALEDQKHDHRWYNLADIYLSILLTFPASGVEAAAVLLKPCMRTHTPTKEFIECLQGGVDSIFHELNEVKKYQEVIDFEVFLHLLLIGRQRSPASNQIISNAYKEMNALEYDTDRFVAFKRFIKETGFSENDAVKETFVKMVTSLLARSRETDIVAILVLIKKSLPQTHEACAVLYYNHMANKQIAKADLNACRTLLLDAEWASIRSFDRAVTEKFSQTVFDFCVETHFADFNPHEAFGLIKEASRPNFSSWLSLFQHIEAVRQKEQVKEILDCFAALAIPDEKTIYVKSWILGLRRAYNVGLVSVKSLSARYEPVRTVVESLSESDVSLDVHLGLFRMLAQSPSEVNCWSLVHYIAARYKKFPKDMEFDMYHLYAYSPRIEEFYQSCKGILGLLISAQVAKTIPKPEVIRTAIDCLKESKRFKATPETLKNSIYTDSMKCVLEIYRRLEKFKPCPVDSWDEVYNSFVVTEFNQLINEVLVYLSEKLKPVDVKDNFVHFPHFKCHLEPTNLLFLFEYLLKTDGLPKNYSLLGRRILGHPTTALILKIHVKKEHWIREILFRCGGDMVLLYNLEDYFNELKDILLFANAPEGVASNPVVRSLFVKLIGTLASSKSPFAASQVQTLFLHCGLGRLSYEKKYQMVSTKIGKDNKIFAKQNYQFLNPRAPFREQESWRLHFLEFQAKLIEQFLFNLLTHGTLNDEEEIGDYFKILIETQINLVFEMCKGVNVPPELSAQLAERMKRFMLTLLMLPKSKEREIKILNEIHLLLNINNLVFKTNFDQFFIIKNLHTQLAKEYSMQEVPIQSQMDLSTQERWINIAQLTTAYTNIQFPKRDMAYLLRLISRLMKTETTVQIGLLEMVFRDVVTYLKKGSHALIGASADTMELFDVFVDRCMHLCFSELANGDPRTAKEQMTSFILTKVISEYAKLANIYSEVDRNRFKPAIASIKILSNLNPIMLKDNHENTSRHISYLKMFSQLVLKELGLCYKFNAFSIAEKILEDHAKLLLTQGWVLTPPQKEIRDNTFKWLLMNLQTISLNDIQHRHFRELAGKLYLFMEKNHIVDS